jgi:APA family basic amino acid/polyamine antiporter
MKERTGGGHLLRVLGLAFGLALGLGGMIGGGILRTPGEVLAEVPSIWLVLGLWAAAAVHSALTGNIVAELMTAVPRSGGLFNVAERAFGAFGGLLVGWTDWLLNVAALAALSIALAEFLLLAAPSLGDHATAIALSACLLFTAINWIGVREGSRAQIATSAAKAALLVGIVILIFLWSPGAGSADTAGASAGAIGFAAAITAYQLIIGAYNGWSYTGYFAEEDRAPQRNIPRSLFGSILAVAAIYLVMNAALVHALPLDRLAGAELPLALALEDMSGPWAVTAVAAIAIVTVIGTINASIMIATRILHGLGRDHFLPAPVAHVNRGGTPDVALLLTAAAACAMILTGTFETAFLLLGALALLIYALIDIAYFVLRWREPDLPRPYRAKLHPLLPALALLLDLGVLVAVLAGDLRQALFIAAAVAICIPLTLLARRARRAAPA